MREYELTFDEHEPIGVPLLMVPSDGEIYLDLRIQAVDQGVLASGYLSSEAVGECTRCLDPVTFEIEEEFQELFHYPADPRHKPKGQGRERSKDEPNEIEVGDEDEILEMEGDFINLDAPIRDALVLNLPVNPLCSEDCEGLCPTCGVKWADLPDDHEHQVSDIRWAGLEDWKGPRS
jgi:uncharacterized protein